MTFRKLRPILAALVVTVLAGTATTTFLFDQQAVLAGSGLRPPIDYAARFAPLRPLLDKDDVVGYLTNIDDTRAYYKARWALSPARVLHRTPCDIAIGDFYDSREPITNAMIERSGWIVLHDCGNGVRLLKRRPGP